MAEEGDLLINGQVYDPNTMTFRETREAERILYEDIFGGDMPANRPVTMNDRIPAMALVLLRRDKPDADIEDTLDLKPSEVMIDEEAAKKLNAKKKAPPTKRAADLAATTSGESGPQS